LDVFHILHMDVHALLRGLLVELHTIDDVPTIVFIGYIVFFILNSFQLRYL